MSNQSPLKIAIIQLTRIGDLIQTAQAVRQFKAENPDTEITLIARRKFGNGIFFLLETIFDEVNSIVIFY
jgi:ADP-heptose:LPS heptosyltransferase